MGSNPKVWTTAISTLLEIFGESLNAIVPIMDTMKIGWRDADAYDDWDEIASVLYRNIVEKSIQHSTVTIVDTRLAPYDLLIPSYLEQDYISVIHKGSEKLNLAFIGYSTRKKPFDVVKCVAVDSDYTASEEILYLPVNECEFELVAHNNGHNLRRITRLTIQL